MSKLKSKVIAALAVTALAGCGTLERQTPTIVTAGQDGGAVALKQGATLVVALEANVTTGSRWEGTAGTGTVLTPLGTPDYLPTTVAPYMIGAGGDMVFHYRAAAPGQANLVLEFRRPFEMGVAPSKSVRYTVSVQ